MQYDPRDLARYSLHDLQIMMSRVVTPANAPTIQAQPRSAGLDKAVGDLGFAVQCLIAREHERDAREHERDAEMIVLRSALARERQARVWWTFAFVIALLGACFGVPFISMLVLTLG